MREIFHERLKKFREWMASRNVEGFLISNQENRFYLSGFFEKDISFVESSGMLLITRSDQFLITDFRYRDMAKEEAPLFDIVVYEKSLPGAICDLVDDLRVNVLGVEKDYITLAFFEELEKNFSEKGLHVEFSFFSGVVEDMRAVKDDLEIELMIKSLELAEEVMGAVSPLLKRAISEKDLAWVIEKNIREKGAEELAFSPIVASGPNSALPHARPTARVPKKGEPIIIDMGARLKGYCSDITRTFFIGKIPAEWEKIYELISVAQKAAQESIKPGMETTEVDRVARQIIEDAGYGAYFGHGLGHGVGLSVHERPGLRKQKPVPIKENMIVTIEPGIYLPGKGGIRLENMVLVTKEGGKLLNKIKVPHLIS